jgi:hypothetical protein
MAPFRLVRKSHDGDRLVDGRELRRIVGALMKGLNKLQLSKVPDPRDTKKTKHRLSGVLRAVVVGLVAGAKSLAELESLTSRASEAFRRMLGLSGRLPDTTMRDVLVQLLPDALRPVLYRQVRALHRQKALAAAELPFGVVSMDGKTTAIDAWDSTFAQKQVHGGSASGAHGLIRTVTSVLISSRAKVCVDASPIPADTNEDGHFATALDELVSAYRGLDLFRMVTYDSGACSLANADHVRSHFLHYFFRLDRKQPTLFAEAQRVLGNLPTSAADACIEEPGTPRGRRERRFVFLTAEMAGFHVWHHLMTVIRVRREIEHASGTVTAEDRYYMSSLAKDRLTPTHWVRLARLRWAVENEGHHTLDVAFEEDRHPWITASPEGALAVLLLRRVAYNLLAVFRRVTQRSEDKRGMPWKALLDWVHDALIASTAEQLHGLRVVPPEPAAPPA